MAPTKYPGESDEAHPGVFITVPPSKPGQLPGQLTPEQVQHFFDEGYVVIPDYFDRKELDACRAAVEKDVENLAQKLYKGGKIKNMYSEYGLFQRLIKIEEEFHGANIILIKLGVLQQAYKDLWSSPRLLNVMEQLLGTSDIQGHPVWNLRSKTPKNEATTVPWHQDCAYLDNDSYNVLQPAAWIPLLDATEENGCMQMVRRGHRSGKMCRHTGCFGNTWYVELSEDEIEKTLGCNMKTDVVTCPIPYGGMLLLNNLIPHRSLNNKSNDIRWSLDLRWQRADLPVGFHGLKNGVIMRSSTNPDLKCDWNFNVEQEGQVKPTFEGKDDEFDTRIVGPWMRRWEITHENRHSAHLADSKGASWHAVGAS